MQRPGHRYKIQSAMEYLMTYGWAILIIAVVMVALFALGVFNTSNFSPRATAGACQVVRNVESTTLQGQCQGELPRYVPYFKGSSYISTPYFTDNMGSMTVSAWMYFPNVSYGQNPRIVANGHTDSNNVGFQLMMNNGGAGGWFDVGNSISKGTAAWTYTIHPGEWYYYVGTYDRSAGSVKAYIDGKQVGAGSFTGTVWSNISVAIGYNPYYKGDYVKGDISNVQIYNVSLSANDVEQLYLEGIGGAPIDPVHIVAWWPLNGNAQDYSGNSNNGNSTGVSYTAAWTSGYSQP